MSQEDTPGKLRGAKTLLPGIPPDVKAIEKEAEEPGEPCTLKGVCTVRRGAAGDVPSFG